jgi:DNA-binding MarR family transcriptional regulator
VRKPESASQPGPVGTPGQPTGRVGQLLFVAQQAAQALATERLEPLGLSPRAWGVLSTLAESGPLTQIELATAMSIDRTAMVYLLDELEERSLVQRVRHPQDRRAFLIHLTAAGQEMQRRAAAALAGAAGTLLTQGRGSLAAGQREPAGSRRRRGPAAGRPCRSCPSCQARDSVREPPSLTCVNPNIS